MGNTLPQRNSIRSITTTNDEFTEYPKLKKSRSLRDYTRRQPLTNTQKNSSTRKSISSSRPTSMTPTDAQIIDIRSLRCALPLSDMLTNDETSATNKNVHNENQLLKQLDYIHSCVRKDKGLFGKFIQII